VGRPTGNPPPVISSSPRMPVRDLRKVLGVANVFVFIMGIFSFLESEESDQEVPWALISGARPEPVAGKQEGVAGPSPGRIAKSSAE
jgi:hypothetical protein